MATQSKERRAEIMATAPVWANCPAFKQVWCHAPWQCAQPCLGLETAAMLTERKRQDGEGR